MQQVPRAFYLNRKSNVLSEIIDTTIEIEGFSLKISNREKEVLQYLAKGHSSKEIAEILQVSYHTVTTYRKKATCKDGC